jgi:hypothetical protein
MCQETSGLKQSSQVKDFLNFFGFLLEPLLYSCYGWIFRLFGNFAFFISMALTNLAIRRFWHGFYGFTVCLFNNLYPGNDIPNYHLAEKGNGFWGKQGFRLFKKSFQRC